MGNQQKYPNILWLNHESEQRYDRYSVEDLREVGANPIFIDSSDKILKDLDEKYAREFVAKYHKIMEKYHKIIESHPDIVTEFVRRKSNAELKQQLEDYLKGKEIDGMFFPEEEFRNYDLSPYHRTATADWRYKEMLLEIAEDKGITIYGSLAKIKPAPQVEPKLEPKPVKDDKVDKLEEILRKLDSREKDVPIQPPQMPAPQMPVQPYIMPTPPAIDRSDEILRRLSDIERTVATQQSQIVTPPVQPPPVIVQSPPVTNTDRSEEILRRLDSLERSPSPPPVQPPPVIVQSPPVTNTDRSEEILRRLDGLERSPSPAPVQQQPPIIVQSPPAAPVQQQPPIIVQSPPAAPVQQQPPIIVQSPPAAPVQQQPPIIVQSPPVQQPQIVPVQLPEPQAIRINNIMLPSFKIPYATTGLPYMVRTPMVRAYDTRLLDPQQMCMHYHNVGVSPFVRIPHRTTGFSTLPYMVSSPVGSHVAMLQNSAPAQWIR